jgi:hypothetical protein
MPMPLVFWFLWPTRRHVLAGETILRTIGYFVLANLLLTSSILQTQIDEA